MKIMISLITLVLLGCASKVEDNHKKFLTDVRTQKQQRTKAQYQQYLQKKLEAKRSELIQVNARLNELFKDYQVKENRDNPMNSYATANQANMTRIQMTGHNLKKQKQMIEKEIFFLQSQVED